jgi:hypothetical protein
MEDSFVPDGGKSASTADDFTRFMTQGGNVPPVVQEVTSILGGDMFDGEGADTNPKNAKGGDWLNSLMADPFKADDSAAQEEAPEEVEEEDGLKDFIAKGGTAKDYYFQQFQAQQTKPAEQPEPELAPAADPYEAELAKVEAQKEAMADKLDANYHAILHAQANGDADNYRKLLRERSNLDMEVARLVQTESFVNEKRGQAVQQTLAVQYQDTYTSLLRDNHGITDQKMLDKVRTKVLETPYIAALLKEPTTAGLMQIPLVREIMTKAALYDAQYTNKRQSRRAPADPGATQTQPRETARPAPTPETPYADDKSFGDFMTKGRAKK